jgi:hypothetical protein
LHKATITLSEFAYSGLLAEAERQGVPLEELLQHAAMYYLADLDSGRLAARVLRDEHVSVQEDDDVGPARRFERPSAD